MSTPETEIYSVSTSPHAHSGSSVQRIMLDVIIAMLPAFAFSIYRYGFNSLRLVVICVVACVALEALCRKMMQREQSIGDLSAVVTGMLLAFNLPPTLPAWQAVVGCVFAIVVAKQIFGGLGYNPFNPALIGRVALLLACTANMTTWTEWNIPLPAEGIDQITTATPLGLIQEKLNSGANPMIPFAVNARTIWDLALGNVNGCLGEGSAIALLLGGIYMLWRRVITWQVPVAFIATVAIFSGILFVVDPSRNLPPHFHLLSGGLMLGALFMATDMVTSPVTRKGQLIFGIGCGCLTMIIRRWGSMPEGVSFAILLMNSVTPLINRSTRPRKFGSVKKA